MSDLGPSLQDKFNDAMNGITNLLYLEQGGVNREAESALHRSNPDLCSRLWDFIDCYPSRLRKWMNCEMSLQAILETTPEVIESELDEALLDLEKARQILEPLSASL